MKKKIIQSFFILTFTTGLSKLFNIINRVILSRYLNTQGMGLYMLIIPTLGLWITLSQLSIPSAIFKLIADPKYNNKKVMSTGFFITTLTTILMMFILIIFSPFISSHLLKNSDTLLPLKALILFIPLTSVSAILKNYFMGRQMHKVIAKTQVTEELTRLFITFVFFNVFSNYPTAHLVTLSFLAMSIGELASIIHLLSCIRPFSSTEIKTAYEPSLYLDFFRISLPMTGSRLLHSVTGFLEPVIITTLMLSMGFLPEHIQAQYGMMSGYVMSMITMPTFLTTVLYRILLPIFLENLNNKTKLLKNLYIGLFICFLISIPFTFAFYFFPENCLSLLYKTTAGAGYLKYLSIPFTLYYLQTPLSALMQALNKNKEMFLMSVLECSLEVILLFVLVPKFHVLSMGLTLLIGITVTLALSSFCIYRFLLK
ncbi:MAG: oligosaccharide flippase family protein [Beduini sp.]